MTFGLYTGRAAGGFVLGVSGKRMLAVFLVTVGLRVLGRVGHASAVRASLSSMCDVCVGSTVSLV